MTTNVLFMCPHAAGKSLAAATYFRAAAARVGLDVEINTAGPDPDEHNMANVQAALEDQGYTIGWQPKLVGAADTERADIIVSIGCTPADVPTDKPVLEWDAPLLSEDFTGSINMIHEHAESLAAQLNNGRTGRSS